MAGYGCPAATSRARIRTRIGFLVIGPNDTGGGSGCQDTGDDISRPLIATSRSPRLPLLAVALRFLWLRWNPSRAGTLAGDAPALS
jgi:hypothetical protein